MAGAPAKHSANRKRGAQKAAATKHSKKKQPQRYVCVCGEEYTDRTDESQLWIGCDQCDNIVNVLVLTLTQSLPHFFVMIVVTFL